MMYTQQHCEVWLLLQTYLCHLIHDTPKMLVEPVLIVAASGIELNWYIKYMFIFVSI